MTRRLLLCGLLLASVMLACFAGWLWMASGPHQVSRQQLGQVRVGMSQQEVLWAETTNFITTRAEAGGSLMTRN
jgi:hypothetical protein